MKRLFPFVLLMLLLPSAQAQVKKAKHIILIGCDGLGAYAIPQADMPHVKALMSDGAWTLKARSVLPSSSAVNWASMLMGTGPTMHGYTEWGSQTPEIPSIEQNRYRLFPSIFGVIREQRPHAKTAAVYSWPGIGYLIEKDAISTVVSANDNEDLCTEEAIRVIKAEKPMFMFIHFDEPDHTGHAAGHRTEAYYTKLTEVDARIGKIKQAISDAGIADQTILIVTSDHGGKDKGHGGKSLDEVEVPWIMHGVGVKKGTPLSSHIITYDMATTIAWILGIKPPQSWRGQAITEAFAK
ncbi:alkaline phosphatase [Sphingobacterium suaedae]|uniref:Alkaline phosphatase n=1 Tax=Sphingobacterium suaedae TaxID=1686402 RepID=A0ABW5KNH2_9SPHI